MSEKKKIKKLKKKISSLKSKLKNQALKGAKPLISPLAPKCGFPDLPVIAGVEFSAASAGVKYQGRDDVMLAKISAGSSVAGVFTQSSTRSAPVLDCQSKLKKQRATNKPIAILVNSGNSNAFTGGRGVESVDAICNAVAKTVGTDDDCVFTASTGVIGEPLPHDRIIAKIETLKESLSPKNIEAAAHAIMTTDTFAKGASASVNIDDHTVQIAGFAKGSGMIAPDMATMLVYIFTDANISQPVLQEMLTKLNEISFNSITVDSDTSTSDSLMVVATGQSLAPLIDDISDPKAAIFMGALTMIMQELAHLVVKDGEGATKFISAMVIGAVSDESAKTVGLAIANSPLVKTAIAGEDPNWGRIVMAVGKSGEPAERDKLTISFGDILVAEKGWVSPDYTEKLGADYMTNQELNITVDLGMGQGQATVWFCDLTHQYITINADYRS